MKKIAFLTGAVVATGGAYGANVYLVNKVVHEIPVQIEQVIASVDKNTVDIETLSTKIDGNTLSQEYAIYLVENGERADVPLYVLHNACVGAFGLNAKGNISLPKEKGLAKEFIEEITSFTETLDYTYTTASQSFDLVSTVDFEPVKNDGGEFVDIGTLRFSIKGNEEKNSGNLILDTFVFNDNESTSMRIDNAEIVFNNTKKQRSSEFTIDKVVLNDLESQSPADIILQKSKMLSQVTLDDAMEYASVVSNWQIDDVSMDLPTITLPSSKVGVTSKFDNLNISKLTAISEAANQEDEEKLLQAMGGFFENGVKVSDIKVYLNDSDITGFVDIKPADYSRVTNMYEAGLTVGQNLKAEFNIKFIKKQLELLNIPVEAVAPLLTEEYNFNEDKDKFTAQLKIMDGKTSINDVVIQ